MFNNLINRFESYQALRVNKNFNSQELTVLGKILLEGAREVEVANVIRFPSIERGFSIFSIESGATLSALSKISDSAEGDTSKVTAAQIDSALPKLTTGLISELKNDAYHLMVRQGNALENGMVLASFSNAQSAGMALRKLASRNARKIAIWKILGLMVLGLLLISWLSSMAKYAPSRPMDGLATSMETRNPEVARQMENINRSRTVGNELLNQPAQQMPMQPDPTSMLGGASESQAENAQTAVTPAAPVTGPKSGQEGGNFGF